MRLKININFKDQYVPRNYKNLIQGFIYNAISNKELQEEIHNEGYRVENRPFKLFTFSDLIGDIKIQNSIMKFSSNGYFYFATIKENLILEIARYLDLNNHIKIGNKLFDILGYDIINDEYYENETYTFKSISPVCVYKTDNKKVIYLDPQSVEFEESIKDNIIKKYFLYFKENPINFKINKIVTIKTISTYFKKTLIIGSELVITFSGINQKIFKIIMNTGIGSKNPAGFGMLKYEKNIISI